MSLAVRPDHNGTSRESQAKCGLAEEPGESVYADIEDGKIKLTTENGYGVTNTICMEPDIFAILIPYGPKT